MNNLPVVIQFHLWYYLRTSLLNRSAKATSSEGPPGSAQPRLQALARCVSGFRMNVRNVEVHWQRRKTAAREGAVGQA